jgi:hypothetical protein
MTPEEKFIFDLDGYIVIQNALSQEEVANLNAIADREFGEPYDDTQFKRMSRISHWDPACVNLFDHPNVIPYLVDLLGPKFRADHDYCIFMKKGSERGRIHGGDTEHLTNRAADHWYKYRDGVMRNGLTVCTFFLTHADEGDGGFGCIPGSHKSNFALNVPDEVRNYKLGAHYVRQPAVEAGDALIFTEALMHGTVPWKADHERRALLYKFSPGHSAWQDSYYSEDEFGDLTDQQKRILAPPSVGSRPDSVENWKDLIAD